MSGGHFDYGCFRISQFAEELEREIRINDSPERNEWDEAYGANFSKGTVENLVKIRDIIALAGKLAKEVEWLYSEDNEEESFFKGITSIVEEHSKTVDKADPIL